MQIENSIYFIPFVVGVASGGQSIHAKLGGDMFQILRTLPGWFYWLSRGVVPLVCYYGVLVSKLNGLHSVPTAMLCGIASEAVLRSRLFIGTKRENGKSQDVYRGLFDLVEWYQNLFLQLASNNLAAGKIAFVQSLVGSTTDFPHFCSRALVNAAGFQLGCSELRAEIEKHRVAFNKEPAARSNAASAELHQEYCYILCYSLMQLVGRKHVRTLFR